MRIAVLNPDTIGDVIIRQPAFAALLDRGHTLTVVLRDLVAPIAELVAPGAAVLQYPCNPYVDRFDWESAAGRAFLDKLRAFDPELILIAPFQYTEFEQSVVGFFPNVRAVAMDGLLHVPGYPPTPATARRSHFRPLVATSVESPETRKNELLCSAALGENLALSTPRISVSGAILAEADRKLERLGLRDESFWCVCAGDFPRLHVKNWEANRWAELLKGIVRKHRVNLLFIGVQEEHEVTARVRELMGEEAKRTFDLTGEPTGLDLLMGLVARSAGYIGKDTGPMHAAAALGKPVVALFGGGGWPRFVPAASIGRVLTVGVPCQGCGWYCHLERSVCVKDIPVADAEEAADLVISGACQDFRAIVLQPTAAASASLVRDAWARYWEIKRSIDKERGDFIQWHQDRVSDIDGLKAELAAASNRVEPSVFEAERERVRQLEAEVDTIHLLRQQAGSFEEMAGRVAAVEERARQLDLRAEELLAERRTVLASHRELAEAKSSVELRFAVFRRKAAEKVLDARRAERLARAVLDDERASAEARVCEAMAAVEADRSVESDRLRAVAAELELLRVRVADSESERLSAIAESQSLLRETQRELDSALYLIPELRTENLAQKQELVQLEQKMQELGSALASCDSDRNARQVQLAEIGGQLANMERIAAERLAVLQVVSKELDAVRGDQAAKQALIERMDSQISIIERDRAERGAQIETLHQMIDRIRAEHALHLAAAEQRVENLRAEFAMYKSRLPIRMLRSVGLA